MKPLPEERAERGPERPGARAARRWLLRAAGSAVVVPLIFYLRFGRVVPLGWGLTVFFVALCLLVSAGTYFSTRAEFHTPVGARGGWADRLGAFWLVACGLGPFFGWVLASAVTLTAANWRWLYWGRVGLSVGLPLATALPLLRYARGRGAPLMLALLLCVTALPCWSAWWTVRDLLDGPSRLVVRAPAPSPAVEYAHLAHTNRVLAAP